MNKLLTTSIAAALCLTGYSSLHAEDTEVYFYDASNTVTVVNPNVLFVFDTSGSMDDSITTRPAYDSSTSYPAASNYDPDYYYIYTSSYNYVNRVHKDKLLCPTMESAISVTNPEYFAKTAYWRNSWWGGGSWSNPCSGGWFCGFDSTDEVECEDDSTESITWSSRSTMVYVDPNFHNYMQSVTTTSERKTDIMISAAQGLVDDFDNLNFALMRFNGGSGGYVIQDFIDITPAANKTTVKNVIGNLPASGSTPLSETLYEAMLYLQGSAADWGNGIGDSSAQTGGVYNSGITQACQQTHIVYLTDGEPTSDGGSDSDIEALAGVGSCSGNCLDELAGHMFNYDQIDDNVLAGDQKVFTHTIGFDIDLDLLDDTATAGGGDYYQADDYVALKSAFTSILVSIGDQKDTFVAPAVSVNAYNSLQNSDQLYYALFQPLQTPRWLGNLKRYRVDSDGVVRDASDNPAIDNSTGYFEETARSWWLGASDPADGNDVAAGGTAFKLGTVRDLYTYTGTTGGGNGPSNVDVTGATHVLDTSNTALTNAMLGLPAEVVGDDQGRADLLTWVEEGGYLGDILHSQPVVVTYGEASGSLVETVFVSTNLGFLHAFDTSDGTEIFGFAPQEVLSNFRLYQENDANTNKIYGLDGTMAVWIQEDSGDIDFNIDPNSSTDKVYIFMGMRRGGDSLYALDVTDIQGNTPSPVLKWQISGGVSDPSGGGYVNDFVDLGQTWSTPRVGKVKWNCVSSVCEDKQVLFFGGGYDPQHDTESVPTNTLDDRGNAIYMVDAETGALLWSMGENTPHNLVNTSMTSSIPGGVSIGDVDSDGYVDLLFAVDILGRVWRVDFAEEPTGTTGAGFATGGVIAELLDYTTGDADFRRFYNAPDVALFRPRGKSAYLSVSVGSGYRSHPNNNDLTDRFYSLKDYNAFNAPVDINGDPEYRYVTDGGSLREIAVSDLANASDNYVSGTGGSASNATYGWYKNLDSGEKVLSSSLTFGGVVIFTTYTPPSASTCGALGVARLYGVDAVTGSSLLTADDDSSILFKTMNHAGIPPEPAIIYAGSTEGTGADMKSTIKPILCVGTECFGNILDSASPLNKSFWREN